MTVQFVAFVAYVDHVICELLLGYHTLLLSIDYEIPSVVISALAQLEADSRRKPSEYAQFGHEHYREAAEEHAL